MEWGLAVCADNIWSCHGARLAVWRLVIKINLVKSRVTVVHKFPWTPASQPASGNVPSNITFLFWCDHYIHCCIKINGVVAASHRRVFARQKKATTNRSTHHGMVAMSTQPTGQSNGMWKTTIHLFTIGPVLENHPQHRFGGKIQNTHAKNAILSRLHINLNVSCRRASRHGYSTNLVGRFSLQNHPTPYTMFSLLLPFHHFFFIFRSLTILCMPRYWLMNTDYRRLVSSFVSIRMGFHKRRH